MVEKLLETYVGWQVLPGMALVRAEEKLLIDPLGEWAGASTLPHLAVQA
jgi:hypothetical protein